MNIILRYGNTLLASWRTFQTYSILTRLRINNYRSFFFNLNIFVFELWRHLATYDATWQALPVNLGFRYTSLIWLFCAYFLCFFGTDVLSRMTSSLLCIYITFSLPHPFSERLIDLRRPFSNVFTFLRVGNPLFYSQNVFCSKFTKNNQIEKG